MRMALGKIVINKIDVAINQDLRALFLNQYVDKQFFFYFYHTLQLKGNGVTVRGIKISELLQTPFPLPPLEEQRRIVEKLESLLSKVNELTNA